ncbi:hypothetical protein CTAYLR_000607 [Chrysophaeum taylorii]|uniref:Uncharacterized protein n=1 Tax=Chrysophaeum taylorii TaxID=2483200 RepID=A0AAD7UIU6_9STRA|nr:hypothetical protein CTAYLR_000607 [Chrysophaeum taylorii]
MSQRDGARRLIIEGDSQYVGEWKGDRKHGFGTLTRGKYRYEGEFSQGKRHGKGVLWVGDKKVYAGDWVEGWRDGHGATPDYVGEFANNAPHGRGATSDYSGEWKNGKREGRGTCEEFSGEWSNDKKHGTGVLTTSRGVIHGTWSNGDLVNGTLYAQLPVLSKLEG